MNYQKKRKKIIIIILKEKKNFKILKIKVKVYLLLKINFMNKLIILFEIHYQNYYRI